MNDPLHQPDWYLDRFRTDVDATVGVLRTADLDATVPACPDWDIRALVDHVGAVFGWATAAAATGERPTAFPLHTDADAPLVDWFESRAATLIETLRGLDPDAPTWHHWPTDRVNRVWPRRMAHEIAVHRWDIETALGRPATIDAELASDGIDEALDMFVRRTLARDGVTPPTGSLHLHCSDADGEWMLELDDRELTLTRAHRKADAALRGPAETLLLWTWGRVPASHEALSPVGDDAVLAQWEALTGV